MNGTIFNIQHFCTNDGPGIRTTIFMKGCPLSCVWCHNPESHSIHSQLMYSKEKCVNCMHCVSRCPNNAHKNENEIHLFDRALCKNCGLCLGCSALSLAGQEISVEKAVRQVLKDKMFYENSHGGVTISGGEPFFQFDFLIELTKKLKEHNIHVGIETCGYVKSEKLIEIAPYIDLFMYDYKLTNPIEHKKYVGVDNKLILENLKILDDLGKQIILRCPIIPTINDTKEHFNGISSVANSYKNILQVEIEPYHEFGVDKYKNLEVDYLLKNLSAPKDEQVGAWLKEIQKNTNKPVIKA